MQKEANRLYSGGDLRRLIIPLIIEQTLAVTIGMADTVMVTGVGEFAVSAISLVDQINFLLITIFSALATGGAVVAAQYIGHRDRINANKTAKQLMYACTMVAILLMVIALAFNEQILRGVYGAIDESVMSGAKTYFYLTALSCPFFAIYNAGAALFRSMGNSKVSMYTAFVMNIVNIAGNAIMIYGFKMGVFGAGLASLVSRILAAAAVFILIMKPDNMICLEKPWKFEFHPAILKNILKIGIPNGVETSIFQVGKLLVAGLISTFGTASIAANAICNQLGGFVCLPGNAIGLAMITVVGQCMGAGEPDQASDYVKKMMIAVYASMGVLNLALFLFAQPLVGIFNLSAEGTQIAVQIAQVYTIVTAIAWPAAFALPNCLRASGDAKFTMYVSVISMFLFRVATSYLLANTFHMGLMGVWVAMYIDWIGRLSMFVPRFFGGKWKKIRVI